MELKKVSITEASKIVATLNDEELEKFLNLYDNDEINEILETFKLSDRVVYALKHIYGFDEVNITDNEINDIRKGYNKEMLKAAKNKKIQNRIYILSIKVSLGINKITERLALKSDDIFAFNYARRDEIEFSKIKHEFEKNFDYLKLVIDVCKKINREKLYNYKVIEDVFDLLENILINIDKKNENLFDYLYYLVKINPDIVNNESFIYDGIINDNVLLLKKSNNLL